MIQRRLNREFYTKQTLKVAKELLGKYLVRKIGRRCLVGKIVETEAYIGPEDMASHAYGGKITERSKTEYLVGGHIYIYLCYGMYWQLNITTEKDGKPECVLIRALEPMIQERKHTLVQKLAIKPAMSKVVRWSGEVSRQIVPQKIANGPGKLCRWMKLDKSFNAEDLTTSKRIWIEDRGVRIKLRQIVAAKRIGIDYAGKWKEKLWRFYIKDSPFISRK